MANVWDAALAASKVVTPDSPAANDVLFGELCQHGFLLERHEMPWVIDMLHRAQALDRQMRRGLGYSLGLTMRKALAGQARGVMYHGTTRGALDAIKVEGIRPTGEIRGDNQRRVSLEHGIDDESVISKRLASVFLAVDEELARVVAEHRALQNGDDPTVITVALGDDALGHAVSDEVDGCCYRVPGTIAPASIMSVATYDRKRGEWRREPMEAPPRSGRTRAGPWPKTQAPR